MNTYFKKWSVNLFTLLMLNPLSSMAIVNMDSLHFDKNNKRFSIDVDLTASGSSGNSNSSKVAFNSQFSWINKKSINLIIMGLQYGESNHVRNMNKSFLHYRHIAKINEGMDWEAFSQIEKNEFTRLSYRGLVGAGLRFSVLNSNKHHAFLGLGGFYSKEETDFTSGLTDGGVVEYVRANIYFFSKYKVTPTLSFSNALYYQPRTNKFSDFRGLLESKFDFKISEDLSFRLSLDVEYDSEPPETIKDTDISYKAGLKYHF